MENRPIGMELRKLSLHMKRYMESHSNCKIVDKLTGSSSWIIAYIGEEKNKDVFQKDLEKKLNDDLSEWDLVRVPIKYEFVDDLKEIIKYEWRYRLYVSKVYEMLGLDSFMANEYSGYYWEKDKDGNIISDEVKQK